MSKLVWWQVENFMSIEKGKCEFDERNIVNLKGYNDSGKSAMLTALKVLMTNCNPTKQADFIQDNKDYFRVLAKFDDGVMVLRDKYRTGQSLYELYKDDKILFSTKLDNGALAPIKEVPKPIADYLGLITYEDITINARACFEKQIGVQTTGSENYKMFNTILRSEELASASAMLNTDKNKLANELSSVTSSIDTYSQMIVGKDSLTKEHIEALKKLDAELDIYTKQQEVLSTIEQTKETVANIKINPVLEELSIEQLNVLVNLANLKADLAQINVTPSLEEVSTEQLVMLNNIKTTKDNHAQITVPGVLDEISTERLIMLNNIKTAKDTCAQTTTQPALDEVEVTQLTMIDNIKDNLDNFNQVNKYLSSIDTQLNELTKQLSSLQEQVKGYVKCPGCGLLFSQEENHAH